MNGLLSERTYGSSGLFVSVGYRRLAPNDASWAFFLGGVFAKLLVFFARTSLVMRVTFAVRLPVVILQERAAIASQDVPRPRDDELAVRTRTAGVQFDACSLKRVEDEVFEAAAFGCPRGRVVSKVLAHGTRSFGFLLVTVARSTVVIHFPFRTAVTPSFTGIWI